MGLLKHMEFKLAPREAKRRRMEIKEISEAGVFEGMLSPYGNVDSGKDVVEPGAYTKTLQEQGASRPLLWQHDPKTPIGDLTLEDRPTGLYCKGRLLLELPEAKKAYLLIKAGIVKGLSIGFESIKDSIENNVRRLKEVKLYEGSIVTFPMNEAALITSVKSRSAGAEVKSDFNEELAERQLCDANYQMMSALGDALRSLTWARMTTEEKITAAETIIDQFREAYMAYLPAYLAMLTEEYGAVETWSRPTLETKAGRKISAATKAHLMECHGHMKSAQDLLLALLDEEAAEEDTSKSEAAPEAKSTEPGDHSKLISQIDELKGVLTWNSNKN